MDGDCTPDVDSLRAWVARELAAWERALLATLDDAIEHLQLIIFDEGWVEIRATVTSDEEALRASVLLYEERLAELLRFVRLAGAPSSAVEWSQLKTSLRRAAREANLDISLRTALDGALYRAETTQLGDHARYHAWVEALMLFLTRQADAGSRPMQGDEAQRIEWAYRSLARLEDHAAFDEHLRGFWCRARASVEAVTGWLVHDLIAFQELLCHEPRYDLVLNVSLRWLANASVAPPRNESRLGDAMR